MMFCWKCENEFDFSQVKVRARSSVFRDGSSPYNDNARCNDFHCPQCGSTDIEEVYEEFVVTDQDGEEYDYFDTEEEAIAAQKGYEAQYHEQMNVVRVLTGQDSCETHKEVIA